MKRELTGPIPGENFTSDTKNYAWHRPPEHTSIDTAIEEVYKKITKDHVSTGILTMIEMGTDISTITDMLVTAGIGAGKWTPDFAILMAGPVAHIIYLMAKGYGLDCELGYETSKRPPTAAFFKGIKKIEEAKAKRAIGNLDLDEVKEYAKERGIEGFAGMSLEDPAKTQKKMLGDTEY